MTADTGLHTKIAAAIQQLALSLCRDTQTVHLTLWSLTANQFSYNTLHQVVQSIASQL